MDSETQTLITGDAETEPTAQGGQGGRPSGATTQSTAPQLGGPTMQMQ